MTEEYKTWEDYFIEGTNTLKNKLGITNPEELYQAEVDICFEKLLELHENPIEGNFDEEHLSNIHRYIFSDIYPFAGTYRTVDVTKVGSFYFTPAKDIKASLSIVLKEIKSDFLKCKRFEDYTNFLAEAFYNLLTVHPFREGNGRTVREFIREFVIKYIHGYTLDWSRVKKDEYAEAIKYAYIGKSLLQMQFAKALVPIEKELKDIHRT